MCHVILCDMTYHDTLCKNYITFIITKAFWKAFIDYFQKYLHFIHLDSFQPYRFDKETYGFNKSYRYLGLVIFPGFQ